jgi:hypothetical protein
VVFLTLLHDIIDEILALQNNLKKPTISVGLSILVGLEIPRKCGIPIKKFFRRYLNDLHKRVPVADLPGDR